VRTLPPRWTIPRDFYKKRSIRIQSLPDWSGGCTLNFMAAGRLSVLAQKVGHTDRYFVNFHDLTGRKVAAVVRGIDLLALAGGIPHQAGPTSWGLGRVVVPALLAVEVEEVRGGVALIGVANGTGGEGAPGLRAEVGASSLLAPTSR
jgi:hypothetical protein